MSKLGIGKTTSSETDFRAGQPAGKKLAGGQVAPQNLDCARFDPDPSRLSLVHFSRGCWLPKTETPARAGHLCAAAVCRAMWRLPPPLQPRIDDCCDVGSSGRSDAGENHAGRTAAAFARAASDNHRLLKAQRWQAVTAPSVIAIT
jgi:hypothetical protein